MKVLIEKSLSWFALKLFFIIRCAIISYSRNSPPRELCLLKNLHVLLRKLDHGRGKEYCLDEFDKLITGLLGTTDSSRTHSVNLLDEIV